MEEQMKDVIVQNNEEREDNENPEAKSKKKRWLIFYGIAVGVIIVIICIFSEGGVQSDLEGDYVLYRNSVFKQKDGIITIDGDQFEWYAYGMLLHSGTYELDEEEEIIELSGTKFHYVYKDGSLIAIYRDTSSGEETYYKQ